MKRWGCTGHVPAVTGERFGHCARCHLDFYGTAAFDRHRRGPQSARVCVDPVTDRARTKNGTLLAEWWRDDKGRWHDGAREGNPWAVEA